MKKTAVINRSAAAVLAVVVAYAIGMAPASATPTDGSDTSSASQDSSQPASQDDSQSASQDRSQESSKLSSAEADEEAADTDSDAAEESTPTGQSDGQQPAEADEIPATDPVEFESDSQEAVAAEPERDSAPVDQDVADLVAEEPDRDDDNDDSVGKAAVTHARSAPNQDEGDSEPEFTDTSRVSIRTSGTPSATEVAAPSVTAEAEVASTAGPSIARSATAVIPAATPASKPIASLVTGMLGLVGLNPSLASAPAAPPAVNTILWSLLGWVRREIQRSFFNGGPTALPVQVSETGAGVVTGDLGARDPEDDPLRYRVIQQPSNGTVTVSSDGTFTYTPKSTPTADYEDTFRVSIRDVGFHLHLFNINGPGRIEVPVTVNVSLNQAPVVTSESTKRLPGAATGLVSGLINVTDPNDNPLTYSVAGGPGKGTVVVDPTTGAFLYRPTATARQAAGLSTATLAAKTDTFTVTVSDGAASTTVTTVVDIAALDNTVVDTVTVGGFPTALAFTRDGSRVLVAGADGIVTVIDTSTNTVAATIDVGNAPSGVVVSPDGNRAYVTNSGGATVSVLNLATSQVIDTIAVGNNPVAIALSADGAKAYVVDGNSASVSVIDTATKAVVTIAVGDNPQAIALTPDGAKAYVTNFTGRTISVIATATNTVVATVAVSGNPAGVAVSPDGKRVYVADFADGVVRVIDTATDKTVAAIGVGDNPEAVVVSPDGTRVYVTNAADNTVSVIDTEVNVVWATIDVGNSPASVVLSPNGTRAYVANANSGTVTVISTVTAADPASAQLGSTRGFTVYNLSSRGVKLAYYETAERPEGNVPPLGTIIASGAAQRFEVVYNFLKTTDLRPVFETIEGPQTFYFTFFSVGPFAGLTAFCKSSSAQECKPSGRSEGVDKAQVYLLDVPGTVINFDNSTQAQQQAQVLNTLCYEGSLAKCEFAPVNQIFTRTPVKVVGSPVINTTSNDQTYNITISDTRSQTDSVNVTVKVAITFIKDKVNGEVTAAYGHSWTRTYTFQQGLTIKVPPGYESQVSAAQPVYRVYGDFTLVMGNTTWNLTNIYFDTPNPDGGEGAYYISEKPYVGAP